MIQRLVQNKTLCAKVISWGCFFYFSRRDGTFSVLTEVIQTIVIGISERNCIDLNRIYVSVYWYKPPRWIERTSHFSSSQSIMVQLDGGVPRVKNYHAGQSAHNTNAPGPFPWLASCFIPPLEIRILFQPPADVYFAMDRHLAKHR